MSSKALDPSERLSSKCAEGIRALEHHQLYTPQEEDLYNRILNTTHPLAWKDKEGDSSTAPFLWSKLQGQMAEEIKISVFFADLRKLDSIVASVGDYI